MNDTIKKLIESEFPFEIFNPGQYEAIEQCVNHIINGKTHIILSCPTGVGKSVIAYTVHKVINQYYMRNKDSVVLTTTKGLQDQYDSDFNIKNLKGKDNYHCHLNLKGGYGTPACVVSCQQNKCSYDKCPYLIAKNDWINTNLLRITNSTLFSLVDYKHFDLCIIDECHELDKVLIDSSTLFFELDSLTYCSNHIPNFKESYLKFIRTLSKLPTDKPISDVVNLLSENDSKICKSFGGAILRKLSEINSELKLATTQKLLSIKNELDSLSKQISSLFLSTQPFVLTEESETSIKFRLLNLTKGACNRLIFNKANHFIHMSATIGGFKEYCKNLKIDESEAAFVDINNPIDVNKRPIFMNDTIHVNMKTDIKLLTNKIEKIIEKENGANGVIHTVSFRLANDIKNNIAPKYKKRMIISNNRKEILSNLSSKSNCIILSPSIETGYDLKDNLARWQIIAKVPFLYLGDNYVLIKKDKNPNWYVREAVLRIIQASGRIVRGMNDYGNTYIIDSNVLRLISNNPTMFPSWWIEAIVL